MRRKKGEDKKRKQPIETGGMQTELMAENKVGFCYIPKQNVFFLCHCLLFTVGGVKCANLFSVAWTDCKAG